MFLIREHYRQVAITTDIIVGFPGETAQEFAETREFVREINFYETHIFKYSPRKGTKAATMPEQVAENLKSERSKAMLELGAANKRDFMESVIGQECEVLVEEKTDINGEIYFVGHTREYFKFAFKDGGNKVGKIVSVVAKDILDGEYILGEMPCIL